MSDPTRLGGFPTKFSIEDIGAKPMARDRRCCGALTADSFGKPKRRFCQDTAGQDKDGNFLGLCLACSGVEREWRENLAAKEKYLPDSKATSRKGHQ